MYFEQLLKYVLGLKSSFLKQTQNKQKPDKKHFMIKSTLKATKNCKSSLLLLSLDNQLLKLIFYSLKCVVG